MFISVALSIAVVCAVAPVIANAKDTQADQQCKAGGTVGQKCNDSTNGYTTSGHCTHINVCKADSWNSSPPKGCGASGNIYAPSADCPKGPRIYQGGTNPPVGTTTVIDPSNPSNSTISSSIFDQAFSEQIGDITSGKKDTVSTTSINGIEYFVSGGESLPAGEPLSAESPATSVPTNRVGNLAGSVSGLVPIQSTENKPAVAGNIAGSYVPVIGTFTSGGNIAYGSPLPLDMARNAYAAGLNMASGVVQGIVGFFIGSRTGLNPDISNSVVSITYQSLYDAEPKTLNDTDILSTGTTQTSFSYRVNERIINITTLLFDSLDHLGKSIFALFTADPVKAKNEFDVAIADQAQAFGLLSNLLTELVNGLGPRS